jgi:hypothetical protein
MLMVFGLYTIDIDIIRLILVGFFFYLVQIWDSTLSPVRDLRLVRLLYLSVVFRTRWAFFGAHCTCLSFLPASVSCCSTDFLLLRLLFWSWDRWYLVCHVPLLACWRLARSVPGPVGKERRNLWLFQGMISEFGPEKGEIIEEINKLYVV